MEKASKKTQGARTTPSDPLRLEAQLCFAVYSALGGINKVYRMLLRDMNLTYPQYLVMLVLWERSPLNVSELCEQLLLETPTITPLLKRLEARGLVRRSRSAEDERQVILSLTDAGRALRRRAEKIPDCVAEAMGLSARDLSALREQLILLRTNLLGAA